MHERPRTTWTVLQAERGAPNRSVVSDTPRPVTVHDTATGALETVDQPGVAGDSSVLTSNLSLGPADEVGEPFLSPELIVAG
ncbi:hypothetical protein BIV25_21765 [Streptomyces sp. MUSC 14]|nr:hypothetical protein BIV25_21765 [Streptomyces sp. MUSC 14]